MHTKNPIILDCTLRDGSYVIDFQFNKNHTKKFLVHWQMLMLNILKLVMA